MLAWIVLRPSKGGPHGHASEPGLARARCRRVRWLPACDTPRDPWTLATLSPEEAAHQEPVGAPIEAVLTDAPAVPPPTGRTQPARVVVHLEAKEVIKRLADGTDYTFWTFCGSVPGKFIRVRQGDTVEMHLANAPDDKMPHNIDLHAVSGPGGGAAASATAPGHESVFTFRALNAGLFVYHCATAPVPMHIANGMYGLILVKPPDGLPPVDREYYVMQGDIYTDGRTNDPGLHTFNQEKADDERPTYVVFNGSVGSLTGDHALTANVGERVRIFFGDGGPNLTSSFHVIGEIFDHAYAEAALQPDRNVQTTLVPSGGAAFVDFVVDVPGTYVLVDHSLTRAFAKGALGQLKVTGSDVPSVFSGKQQDNMYAGDGAPAAIAPPPAPDADPREHGREVFATTCGLCHQPDGKGIPATFPPLAGSEFVNGDPAALIAIPLHGKSGKITVAGQPFDGVMPPFANLSDRDLADVLTYVRSSFGNASGPITPEQVATIRAEAP